MKQTIEINVPEGYTAKWNEETKQIDLVKETSKSHSWGEFCKNHSTASIEYYIDDCGRIVGLKVLNRLYRNWLESREDAEGILALIQLTRLHDEWVNGWKPNFNNPYYCIVNIKNRIGVTTVTIYNNLLSFPTMDMAEEFFDCFKDLIETAKKFI